MKLLTGTIDHHYALINGGAFAKSSTTCALVEARTTHPDIFFDGLCSTVDYQLRQSAPDELAATSQQFPKKD